jgi:hypothetical protein
LSSAPGICRWGASADEVNQRLPGDELIPSPRLETTRAIAIAAPPERVWPWLIQLGTGRAGWYSYDFLENLMGLGVRSANRIVPDLQHLAVGDVIPAAPPPYLGFRVLSVEPARTLVTSTSIDMITGQSLDAEGPLAGRRLDASWTFSLRRLDESRCRLIARLRVGYSPSLLNDLAVRAVIEPAHFVMEREMLRGIKQRAETVGQTSKPDR